MSEFTRENWSRHIDQVLRSRHYTWIAEGLGGVPLDEALRSIAADLMHMCQRSGLNWSEIHSESQQLYEHEEAADSRSAAHAA